MNSDLKWLCTAVVPQTWLCRINLSLLHSQIPLLRLKSMGPDVHELLFSAVRGRRLDFAG